MNDYSSHGLTVAPTRPAGKGDPPWRAGAVLLLALILAGCAARQPGPPPGEAAVPSGVVGGARYMALLAEREPELHGDIASELRKRRRDGAQEAALSRELAATFEAHVQARLTHVPDSAAHALYRAQLALLREAAERAPEVCPVLLRNTLPPASRADGEPDLLRRWAGAGLNAVRASYESEVPTPEPPAARRAVDALAERLPYPPLTAGDPDPSQACRRGIAVREAVIGLPEEQAGLTVRALSAFRVMGNLGGEPG